MCYEEVLTTLYQREIRWFELESGGGANKLEKVGSKLLQPISGVNSDRCIKPNGMIGSERKRIATYRYHTELKFHHVIDSPAVNNGEFKLKKSINTLTDPLLSISPG